MAADWSTEGAGDVDQRGRRQPVCVEIDRGCVEDAAEQMVSSRAKRLRRGPKGKNECLNDTARDVESGPPCVDGIGAGKWMAEGRIRRGAKGVSGRKVRACGCVYKGGMEAMQAGAADAKRTNEKRRQQAKPDSTQPMNGVGGAARERESEMHKGRDASEGHHARITQVSQSCCSKVSDARLPLAVSLAVAFLWAL